MCKSSLLSLCCLQFYIRSWVHRGPNFRPISPAISSSFLEGWGDCKMSTYQMGDVIPPAHPGSNPDFLNRMGLTSPGRHPKGILTPDTWPKICNFNLTSFLTFQLVTLSRAQKLIWIFLSFQMKGKYWSINFRVFPASFPLFRDWCRITQMLYHTLVRWSM